MPLISCGWLIQPSSTFLWILLQGKCINWIIIIIIILVVWLVVKHPWHLSPAPESKVTLVKSSLLTMCLHVSLMKSLESSFSGEERYLQQPAPPLFIAVPPFPILWICAYSLNRPPSWLTDVLCWYRQIRSTKPSIFHYYYFIYIHVCTLNS